MECYLSVYSSHTLTATCVSSVQCKTATVLKLKCEKGGHNIGWTDFPDNLTYQSHYFMTLVSLFIRKICLGHLHVLIKVLIFGASISIIVS